MITIFLLLSLGATNECAGGARPIRCVAVGTDAVNNFACGLSTVGLRVYVDDTDDALSGYEQTCLANTGGTYAWSNGVSGADIPNCAADNETLNYSTGTGLFTCGDDDTGAGGGAGAGACGANTWASTLNEGAPPTCTQPGFANLSGAATDAQVPDTITVDLAAAATALAADPADCATSTHFAVGSVASGAATCEAIADVDVPNNITIDLAAACTALAADGGNCSGNNFALGVDTAGAGQCAQPAFSNLSGAATIAQGGTTETASTEDAVLVGASTTDWAPKVIPDCDADNQVLHYDQTGNAFSCGDDDTAAGGPTILTGQVNCAVSASYCTIFSYTPSASKTIYLTANLIIDSGSTTVAPQFRVSSADSGYTGRCSWELFAAAVATTTAPIWVHTAIGTAPADTAGTTWGSVDPQPVELHCVLIADASPGAILIEWQLETGTSPTQSILVGSYYTAITN